MVDVSSFMYSPKPINKINVYNTICQMDMYGNYSHGTQISNNMFDLTDIIARDYNNMTREELKYLLPKCLCDEDMRRIILDYELRNIKVTPTNMCLKKFICEATKVFKRYQFKAGGFALCDSRWKVYDHTSGKYTLCVNEVIFENMICGDTCDTETFEYLKNILRVLSNMATSIRVSFHTISIERDAIQLIIIKCVEKLSD